MNIGVAAVDKWGGGRFLGTAVMFSAHKRKWSSGSQRVFVLASVAAVIALPSGGGLFCFLCGFCVRLRISFNGMSAGDKKLFSPMSF